MQGYQEKISNAKSDVGNRIQRLDLTKTRLTEQKTNFTSLKSQNEDIDLEEVVVNYTAAQLYTTQHFQQQVRLYSRHCWIL